MPRQRDDWTDRIPKRHDGYGLIILTKIKTLGAVSKLRRPAFNPIHQFVYT